MKEKKYLTSRRELCKNFNLQEKNRLTRLFHPVGRRKII
jgi:hypothetical protein